MNTSDESISISSASVGLNVLETTVEGPAITALALDAYVLPATYETKPAYSVNEFTREYTGETTADPSPLEPGVWLLPAHAYFEKPPSTGLNEKAVMTDTGWTVLPDFRGAYYLKTDGSRVLFSEFGPLPDTLTTLARPSNLYTWVGGAWVLDEVAELAQLTTVARAERDHLLAYATLRINPLQDDVDNDESTPEGVALLKLWKQYRSAVSKTETKSGWPRNPQWPVPPVPLEVNNSEIETAAPE